ncbi:MAG: type II toxin-antitoxin system RelE/ParE family toxin [Ruminococcus flavefaciens]|nr:type II toxin-antitoxin system RelE/ParE family toxin [Ruminococcus flavefaciens]
MRIRYSKKSLKFLAKQEKAVVNRIRMAINKLSISPSECDIKNMEGEDKGRMRMRVGSFRVIYFYRNETEQETITENGQEITKEIEIEILFIDEIGNRGDIYK